jgi:hypothetical protein
MGIQLNGVMQLGQRMNPKVIKINQYETGVIKKMGGFNYASSSEISWEHFNEMILESIKRNHFSQQELDEIITTITTKTP